MIQICKGDVTDPENLVNNNEIKIIFHCCNDDNGFGSGVAGSIAKKWPEVKSAYHSWFLDEQMTPNETYRPKDMRLGDIQIVYCGDKTYVCNIVGQKGMGNIDIGKYSLPPVKYEALHEGFLRLRQWVETKNTLSISLHAPLLGSGLAGGDFSVIYLEYLKAMKNSNIATCFYAYSDSDYDKLNKCYKDLTLNQGNVW